jgi:hypothetical protein
MRKMTTCLSDPTIDALFDRACTKQEGLRRIRREARLRPPHRSDSQEDGMRKQAMPHGAVTEGER